ncbi:alpha/beta hydrolase [Nocardia asteroides]|uniref:Mycolyltransferase n=1 Tax=Nocardia asteroides NBRC 15531 TaxID=1110697 RepID=U5ELB9_NOCAS|nr:alpha/beta hydrolase family protein [Nocardia asteroides]UGT51190.1 esterase family protein [Nocardia asteroides]GAD85904.1 putative mycolyltransferase [Nocardia asteroides NBRC 15531]SFM32666.1 diacylglycerol O-acyltransferase / trehalose O-mycolyltransferase [Nocardia asteroides]VEG35929.1 Mycolyl transferase 85C [Nocardia asteroides]
MERDKALIALARMTLRLSLFSSLAVLLVYTTVPRANAAFDPAGVDFWVDSDMGPVKSRVFRAADGNTQRVVYALDGMWAREDLNGWEIETDIARTLTAHNINVVLPIGGQSSFYMDWDRPSDLPATSPSDIADKSAAFPETGPGKSYTYTWETLLTRVLPAALDERLGLSPVHNGVVGLSMGGSAALALAAHHPNQFSYAASLSGYLTPSAPGMRGAIAAAMAKAGGYNIACMISSPTSDKWERMDPMFLAPDLIKNGTRVWVSAATGVPTEAGEPSKAAAEGSALETLSLSNSRSFQARMTTLGASTVTYDFPPAGVHAWPYWEAQVGKMLPTLSSAIG